MNKCPLCGGKINMGQCCICSYKPPDESVIAAPYNYSPEDYTVTDKIQADVSELDYIDYDEAPQEPKPQDNFEMKSLPLPPKYSVPRHNMSQQNFPNQSTVKLMPRPQIKVQNMNNIRAVKKQPVINQTANIPFVQPKEPLHYRLVNWVVAFTKAHWWQLLLTLCVPVLGFGFCGFYVIKYKDTQVFSNIFLAILFFVISAGLMKSGIDIFNANRLVLDFFEMLP